MASTTDTSRSLFREALNWALPELAGYVLAALGAVLAFTIGAAFYTYVWPGKPPTIEAPRPAVESQQRKNWSRPAVVVY
jgi:hypothetical protein